MKNYTGFALRCLQVAARDTQRYAVLATGDRGQPYTSLMALAATGDLMRIILLTERDTKKHANLESNNRVAILIDNRENSGADTKDAVAVTAIGEAEEIAAKSVANLLELHLARHTYLESLRDLALLREGEREN